jgi:hypothetical protein
MSEQIPSVGRVVHYRLSAQDVEQIMRRRTTDTRVAEGLLWGTAGRHREALPAQLESGDLRAWPAGAQAHLGNKVAEGDTFPMLIVRCACGFQLADSHVNPK